jgi:hypothetical protein
MLVLAIYESLGPLLFAMAFTVRLLINPRKILHFFILVNVIASLMNPFLSILKLKLHDTMVSLFSDLDLNQAQSLRHRFDSEEILISSRNRKIYFNWGR